MEGNTTLKPVARVGKNYIVGSIYDTAQQLHAVLENVTACMHAHTQK